jgi:hypothetical protein
MESNFGQGRENVRHSGCTLTRGQQEKPILARGGRNPDAADALRCRREGQEHWGEQFPPGAENVRHGEHALTRGQWGKPILARGGRNPDVADTLRCGREGQERRGE